MTPTATYMLDVKCVLLTFIYSSTWLAWKMIFFRWKHQRTSARAHLISSAWGIHSHLATFDPSFCMAVFFKRITEILFVCFFSPPSLCDHGNAWQGHWFEVMRLDGWDDHRTSSAMTKSWCLSQTSPFQREQSQCQQRVTFWFNCQIGAFFSLMLAVMWSNWLLHNWDSSKETNMRFQQVTTYIRKLYEKHSRVHIFPSQWTHLGCCPYRCLEASVDLPTGGALTDGRRRNC